MKKNSERENVYLFALYLKLSLAKHLTREPMKLLCGFLKYNIYIYILPIYKLRSAMDRRHNYRYTQSAGRLPCPKNGYRRSISMLSTYG